jgi:alanyl-tRNA synthetase
MINLIGESSVGSTNRRVESLVGIEAFRDLAAERAIVTELTTNLKTPREKLPERISELVANLKAAEKKIAQFEAKQLLERVPALVETATRVGSVRLIAQNVGELRGGDELRQLAMSVRERLGSDPAVVALTATVSDRPIVLVATNQAARDAGAKAGKLVSTAAGVLGGRGGGKDDLAQGGGSDAAAIPAALAAIADALNA